MRVISPKRITDFVKEHPDSATPLKAWLRVTSEAEWKTLADVRGVYPLADLVGRRTVFNIKGNSYRLIARVNFHRRAIYILHILTHAEYDKGKWKQ